MGKKGAGTGVNTKVQAAREKQAVVDGARATKARASEEAAEAKEWSKGSNQRGSKREEDASRKQDEKAAKLAAKKALQEQETEQLAGFKSVVVRERRARGGGVTERCFGVVVPHAANRNVVNSTAVDECIWGAWNRIQRKGGRCRTTTARGRI